MNSLKRTVEPVKMQESFALDGYEIHLHHIHHNKARWPCYAHQKSIYMHQVKSMIGLVLLCKLTASPQLGPKLHENERNQAQRRTEQSQDQSSILTPAKLCQ